MRATQYHNWNLWLKPFVQGGFELSVAASVRRPAMAAGALPLEQAVSGALADGEALLEALAQEALAEGQQLLSTLAAKRHRQEQALAQLGDLGVRRLFYKAVARTARPRTEAWPGGRRMVSIFDGVTEYVLGTPTSSTRAVASGSSHLHSTRGWRGELLAAIGQRFFVYGTLEEAVTCPFPQASRLVDYPVDGREICAGPEPKVPVVVLLVAGLGEPEYHGRGKFSFPSLLPLAVVPHKSWRPSKRWR